MYPDRPGAPKAEKPKTDAGLLPRSVPLTALAVLLASSHIAPAHSDSWSDPSVLRIAVPAGLSTTNPAEHLHTTDKAVLHHVAEGLVGLRDDLSVGHVLTESIDVSADGKTYTFKLRPGVIFHNGAPLTAEDVRWAWTEYYLKPENEWECLARFDGRSGDIYERTFGGNIVAIDAPDERTVVFSIAAPSSVFLHRMADSVCTPFIFHRDSIGEDGTWDRLIGTGPYQFLSETGEEHIVLKRFPAYAAGDGEPSGLTGARKAVVETLEFIPITSESEQVRRFLDREIDILDNISLASRAIIAGNSDAALLDTPMTSWWTLLIQSSDPQLGDRRIRKAIAHAIDAEEIAHVITEGRQAANPSIVMPMTSYHTSAHDRRIPFEPKRARALLKQAGYDGSAISLQTSQAPYPHMYYHALLLRSMLRAVGMNVELQVLDWESQLENYQTGNFQLSSFGYGGRDHPLLAYGLFTGSKDVLRLKQWDNEQVQQQLLGSLSSRAHNDMQTRLDDLHRAMLEEIPMLPLYPFELHAAVAPTVRGFRIWARDRARLWGVRKGESGESPPSN